VWHLEDPAGLARGYAVWVRRLPATGHTLYVGCYGECRVPGGKGPCLKVVFPLPNGNAIVLMKPVVHDDGSLSLVSSGRRFGDPGLYFTVRRDDGRLWARYVASMRESIRVYEVGPGEARADHAIRLWGFLVLRVHYRLRRRWHPAA
jgi:hypothetical protein